MPANNYKQPILVGSSVSEKRLSGTSRRHKNPHKVVHALDYFLDLDEADESFTAVHVVFILVVVTNLETQRWDNQHVATRHLLRWRHYTTVFN
jgi:hypothetical protein